MKSNDQSMLNLAARFAVCSKRYSERPALRVEGRELSYRELADRAGAVSRALRSVEGGGGLVSLLAHRSVAASVGVLGILAAGSGYVPLNPKFPAARNRKMLVRSGAEQMVVGPEALDRLIDLLAVPGDDPPCPLQIFLVDFDATCAATADELRQRFPQHEFHVISSTQPLEVADVDPDSIAYLLFTSGSTGEPKGVPVAHRNVQSYIDYIGALYGVGPEDRLSQTFDLTFDLSVHDLFLAWSHGACLCVVAENMTMAPARFIRDEGLTMWFSVPSVAVLMERLRMLRPGLFPTLRWSLFCGEPLPGAIAQAWQKAAPTSIVENLYGPTEATIAITRYRWDQAVSPDRCHQGVVPIGWAFDGQATRLVDTQGAAVARGEAGELCLGGDQVTAGYWNDPDQTTQRFVELPGTTGTWYRTGDLARREEDDCLIYLGRLDHQVKIRGFRVELLEIDHVLQRAAGVSQAVSVAWPNRGGSAEGIVGFIVGSECDYDADVIREQCARDLPEYMVPRSIQFLESMPLNANGKIDRRTLVAHLEDGKDNDGK